MMSWPEHVAILLGLTLAEARARLPIDLDLVNYCSEFGATIGLHI